MAPALAQFEQKYGNQCQVISINVDERKPEHEQYRRFKTSKYIPETVVLKNGQPVAAKTGGMTVEDLVNAMKSGQ